MIEQRAVAFRRRLELGEELGEQRDVELVDLRHPGDLRRVVAVVRQRVVRVGHADLGIGAVAGLAGELEGDDAGDVALEGQHLQVEHQPGVVGVGRRARRPGGRGPAADCPSTSASAFWMRRSTSRTVSRYWPTLARSAGPSVSSEAGDVVLHEVEQAGPAARARPARSALLPPSPKRRLEHEPRMRLGRQRRRRRRPGQIVLVDAGVAVVALADGLQHVHRQFERRQLRLPADLLGGDLVDRRAEVVVGALGVLGAGRR